MIVVGTWHGDALQDSLAAEQRETCELASGTRLYADFLAERPFVEFDDLAGILDHQYLPIDLTDTLILCIAASFLIFYWVVNPMKLQEELGHFPAKQN